jgi:hypothetical protein
VYFTGDFFTLPWNQQLSKSPSFLWVTFFPRSTGPFTGGGHKISCSPWGNKREVRSCKLSSIGAKNI